MNRVGHVLPPWPSHAPYASQPGGLELANIFLVLLSQALDAVLKPALFVHAAAKGLSDSVLCCAPRQTRGRGKRNTALGRPAIIVLAQPRSGSEKEK